MQPALTCKWQGVAYDIWEEEGYICRTKQLNRCNLSFIASGRPLQGVGRLSSISDSPCSHLLSH